MIYITTKLLVILRAKFYIFIYFSLSIFISLSISDFYKEYNINLPLSVDNIQ